MPDISVVIPAYKSAAILPELVTQLNSVLPSISTHYEIILVCDGSPDNSWEVICGLSRAYPHIRGFRLSRNYGQHNALLVGIRETRYEITVTMDDDLQHPPQEIPKLIKPLLEGYDVVYGAPAKFTHDFLRNISARVMKSTIQHLIGVENATQINAFRAFRSSVRDSFAEYRDKFVYIDILLTWGTNKFTSVEVAHNPRHSGVSGYSLWKLVSHTTNIITSFSAVPLQVASLAGFTCMAFGILIFIYVIVNFLLHGGGVPGFTFTAAIIALFSGVQLFSLGIIGEYLARIHFRSMGQPYAIVLEQIGKNT